MICIGGEHEDYYDPDFCIYNDDDVLDLDGSIEIYSIRKTTSRPRTSTPRPSSASV